MKPKNVGILSLGCPRNLVDSENILASLDLKGHKITDMQDAEIGIVNTCGFIQEAKEESIEAIMDLISLKENGRLKKIIVYGCLVERYSKELKKELPEIDALVGRVTLNHSPVRYALTPRHYAYLKICESCINNCSYCIIPKIKGKFSSIQMRSAINRASLLDNQGVRELNIIGQDITGYGLDLYGKLRLAELIRKILIKVKNIPWIRLLYLNPERVDTELLELIRDEERICKYVDLPIQHINNRILKMMNRKTSRKLICELIDKIRKIIPHVAIRTSLIVGFPSESKKEFQELLSFIKEVKFDRLGAFIYSREEGTRAYDFSGQVSAKLKQERFSQIMSVQQDVSNEVNSRFLGKIIDVIIDEVKNGDYIARSRFDAPEVDGLVYVQSGHKLKVGDLVRVEVRDCLEYDLVGRVI
ncbi:MAG: MiaB/RimO family radical SAM methylthiotransferase [Candidatus Omnitrophota bacterium]|nr:MiaB/RimO family radical SAM methylthiotransferase [Candidatus Omnitrophota bacterium]